VQVRKHTDHVETYDSWLRGMEQLQHLTKESIAQARRMFERAIEAVEKAIRLNPRPPTYYLNTLGWNYFLAGQYEEAISALKKAISHNPNYLYAHTNLAGVYGELGRVEEAQAEATEILRLNPTYSLEVARQMLPYKDPAVLERTLAAQRKAGLK